MVRFVVMAAGSATRMGRDKLVLPWLNTTVLGYVLRTVLDVITLWEQSSAAAAAPSAVTELYVVARHPIDYYLAENLIWGYNSHHGVWIQVPGPQPLAETIHAGLQNLSDETQYIGFLPGDQVGISATELAGCLQQLLKTLPDFLVPMAEDKAVSPVFFHRQYVSELLKLKGEQGGREVLYRYPERWQKYAVRDSFNQDVDTPEQYNALREQYSKGESSE